MVVGMVMSVVDEGCVGDGEGDDEGNAENDDDDLIMLIDDR